MRHAVPLIVALVAASAGCTGSSSRPASAPPSSPPAAVGHIAVTPAGHLRDGQRVAVRLSGFAPDARARLSECAGATAVNRHGCGLQTAQQPFVDLDAHGSGTARFTVTAFAADGPAGRSRLGACRQRCRLEAVDVSRGGRQTIAAHRLRFGRSVRHLVGPESLVPGAGACSRTAGPVVTVSVNPDVPDPRCTEVRPDQHLRVVNTSDRFGQHGKTITVRWPSFASRTLPVGSSTVYARPLGSYLARGVHDLRLSIYAGGGAEIWLRH
jgi:hypothetical protein